jgi:hypothetical protein
MDKDQSTSRRLEEARAVRQDLNECRGQNELMGVGGSAGRIRTYNQTVNSRLLYH